jgi:hypothetical protein
MWLTPPRVIKQVATEVGTECVRQVILEAERRYCGNTTEELTGAAVIPSDREKMASLLNPRTNQLKLLFHDRAYQRECKRLLKEL